MTPSFNHERSKSVVQWNRKTLLKTSRMTEAAAAAAAAAPATEETPTVVAEDKTTLVLADSKGHILRRTEDTPSGEEATCQHCHKPFGADGYACDKCADVRLCGACAAALAQRVRCGKPERHVLRGFLHDDLCKAHPEYLEGYACDECCEFGPFEAVFHCTECEYDLCPACAGSMMVCAQNST